jgi:hypothetical protein
MKLVSFLLALAAAVNGIAAAFYWGRSANIDQSVDPKLPLGDVTRDSNVLLGYLEYIYRHLFRLQDTARDAARPNREAAFWTGVSVFLSGLSAVFSNWP